MTKICVVGLGDLGKPLLEDLKKGPYQTIGYDIDPLKTETSTLPLDCDAYVITVLTTDQVLDTIKNIPDDKLIFIESTVSPHFDLLESNMFKMKKTVVFPHRWFAHDPEHQFFNQPRIIGCEPEIRQEVMDFLLPIYQHRNFDFDRSIIMMDKKTAALSKCMENAVRYVEIALAEEIKMMCDLNGMDFEKLRSAINTKWNIDLKKAQEGIGGHCLPKDTDLVIESGFAHELGLFTTAKRIDQLYRKHLALKKAGLMVV